MPSAMNTIWEDRTRSNIWNDNITTGQIQHLEIPNYQDRGVMVSPWMYQSTEMRKPNDSDSGRPSTDEIVFTFPRSTGAVASSRPPMQRRGRLRCRYIDLQTSYQRALSPQDYGFSQPAYPGTPSWPSAHAWSSLNRTLDGRLLRPVPPGAVCHPDQPTFNSSLCAEVAAGWKTYEFHVESPVSVMWDKFDNFTCLPEEEAPCSPAGYPAYVVNASNAQHVKIGIDFARKHNVRLNVKNTGHDYLGRSNSPGSLSIWTHHLNAMTYNKGQYRLHGSGKVLQGNSITVGGGSEMYNIYAAADKHNETIVGGGGKTVGIGGYITGGGHSVFAPKYGLAADNVWEMEIVTPGGDIVFANEDEHSDLFWAMRGGGGSTFGVITSVTLKTHPSPKILGLLYGIITDPKEPLVYDLITYILSQTPYLMAQGLSGYNLITRDMATPLELPGVPDRVAGILGSSVLQDVESPEAVQELFQPLNDTIRKRWGDKVQFYVLPTAYDSWLAWFSNNYDTDPAGGSQYLVSRLLDGQALTGNQQKLKSALQATLTPSGTIAAFMVGGKGVHDARPRGGSNAVNPAWRSAYLHTLTSQSFGPFNKTAEEDAIVTLDSEFQPLRDLTPKSGAYINEACLLPRVRVCPPRVCIAHDCADQPRGEDEERTRRGRGEDEERTRRGRGEDEERTRRGRGEDEERTRRGRGEDEERTMMPKTKPSVDVELVEVHLEVSFGVERGEAVVLRGEGALIGDPLAKPNSSDPIATEESTTTRRTAPRNLPGPPTPRGAVMPEMISWTKSACPKKLFMISS
ncbi:hypothetical protein TgHK011_004854 [Trichoderma gracile]|nr:hypothetical protein TgHK011_004854 [Trichoderma gracile]